MIKEDGSADIIQEEEQNENNQLKNKSFNQSAGICHE